ncbi:MAG: efflux RND transporter periplasmic adaptor subunit [Acidobacteriaceae bacterium]|nr:efflux RND transporter periplasmic adaptor subunit [Acidobacteriaceae bacterium]
MIITRLVQFTGVAAVAFATVITESCQSGSQAQGMAMPPVPVSVVELQPHDVPIYGEYAGQTFGRDTVEVRARVDGYLEKRMFGAGTDVRAGQVLYVLDQRPFIAQVEKAKAELGQSIANLEFAKNQVALVQTEANLAQAKANLDKAQHDVDRLKPLVSQDAASQQDLDNALAALESNKANVAALTANVDQTRLRAKTDIEFAKAQVDANQAVLKTAELDLGYTTIASPVSGRIGESLVQVGGLVSRSSPTPLTTVAPLDPIWFRFKISDTEYLNYMHSQERQKNTVVPVTLKLADGTDFPHTGQIRNNVNQLDLKTGSLEIDCTFPNPERVLLPGQFGVVRVLKQHARSVIVIPQRAVVETQNMQSVFTVGADNKAQIRNITTGDRIGDGWIVTDGLKPGDVVIVEGVQKIRPGAPVQTSPYKAPGNTASQNR